jgi:hypothetical protein
VSLASIYRWYNITGETLTRVSLRVADAEIKKHCGPDGTWATPIDIVKAYERRAERLRGHAMYIRGSYLPDKIMKALLTGKYKVTAHRQDGSLVILTAATLAGLDMNLQDSQLSSPSASYSDVSVVPLQEGQGRRRGSGKYDDMPHLEVMKKLLEEKKAKSANHAATLIADNVLGTGTWQSKVERLGRAYKSWENSGFPNSG